ncbi:PREDICTED: aminopeptidase N-like isoform X2 [Vollenhovia emeryi]|uniref:aminopeptidase N-like isoform X2 n=1 Tax=Vollenhovia emeryi TaxID=411798 RepID=UPI0005F3D04D|nr:PREDICTED: aminopeptidase N-like isoform X2 [Vollenhovia emeryi]
MELLKLIFSIIFITASLPEEMLNVEAIIKYPLTRYVKPIKYKILLKVDIENNSFRGISNVVIKIVQPKTTIALHSVYLNIIPSKTVVFNSHDPNKTKHVVTNILYLREEEMVKLYFKPKLRPGFHTLNMEYTGNMSDNMGGFFKIPYTNKDEKKWPLRAHDLNLASHIIEKSTSYFETQWTYWSQVEDHFAIPGFVDDGITKWRLVFYREQDIIYDEELDHIGRKMEIAFLIGRKIGLQRLAITNPSSPYFWLNEGIAVLYAFDSINEIYPELRIWDLFVVQIVQESLHLDNEGIMNPLIFEYDYTSDINSQFFLSSYIKAPAILRMLQHILRYNVFRKGIEKYIKSESATLNDFLDAMQTVHNEEQSMLPYNITEIIYPWLSQSHYPVLSVTEQYEKLPPYVKIKIENGSGTWWIPFTTNVTSSSLDFNTLDISVELWKDKDEKSVMPTQRLAPDYWIILNVQQIGYYRVKYDIIHGNIWQNIVRYLNSEYYTNIHVLNRAQIIDDVVYFTMTDQLSASVFWTLTSYLSQDTDYIAWYPLIKGIERMSYIIPFPKKGDMFKDILYTRLEPVLEIIGYEEDPQDNYLIKCLRQEITKWTCVLSRSESKCTHMALKKLEWHLSSPIHNKLLPGWKKWTFCNGLKMAGFSVFATVYLMCENGTLFQNDRKKCLEFLACSQFFYITITDNNNKDRFKGIRQDTFDDINFFHTIATNNPESTPLRNTFVLDYILNNWMEVKPKEISTVAALIDIINHVYTKESLDKILEFVNNRMLNATGIFDSGYLFSKFNKQFGDFDELIADIQSKIGTRLTEITNWKNTFGFHFR